MYAVRILAFTLAAFVVGCIVPVSSGRPERYAAAQIARLELGKTDRRDMVNLFGSPELSVRSAADLDPEYLYSFRRVQGDYFKPDAAYYVYSWRERRPLQFISFEGSPIEYQWHYLCLGFDQNGVLRRKRELVEPECMALSDKCQSFAPVVSLLREWIGEDSSNRSSPD